MKKCFLLLASLIICISLSAQDITGAWHGLLDLKVAKLRLVLNIERDGEGYKATMDSPDQGAKDIPATQVTYNDGLLTVEIKPIQFVYSGVLKGDSIVGTFAQAGQGSPMTLTKEEIIQLRPQEPKPPFSYELEDVTFYNSGADINLAGTLTYPSTGNNFPAVVLVTGSGLQNRDEEIFGHKPFLVIADYLTKRGIAVLRFDDRGFAKSGGDSTNATTRDFATDAYAAVTYLKGREEIDKERIGIIGHSEGGIIAFMLAATYPVDIAYVVSMAGSAVDGNSILKKQRELIMKAQGATETQIEVSEQMMDKIVEIAKESTLEDVGNENMNTRIKNAFSGESPVDDNMLNAIKGEIIKMISSPWMFYFMGYNPADDIVKITCPILALNGEKDLQVDAEQNIGSMEELKKGNDVLNAKLTTKVYLDLNHLFQHCNTGLPTEYGQIEETIFPEVLEDMATWIKKVVK